MSYQIKISSKDAKAARFISRIARLIQDELIASGMTQQDVATKIDVDRSVVNKRLKGSANLTARSIAEFAYAFDKEIDIKFVERKKSKNNCPAGSELSKVFVLSLDKDTTPTSSSQEAVVKWQRQPA